MSASSFAFPWSRLRRRAACLLCWTLLLQSAPGLAQAVRLRSEPRGWPVVAGKIRLATDWAGETACVARSKVAAVSRWMRSRVSEATDSFLLTFAEPIPANAEPPSTPPSPPGFSDAAPRPASRVAVLPAAAGSIPVAPGWNLVSLPAKPLDSSPQAVFAPMGAAIRQVFAYDACDTADPWKVYDPADPAGSDLASVDERPGLWIDASQATGVPSPDPAPASTTIHLCPGWNLIGFPSDQSRPVAGALSSIAGKYQRVFGYEAADTADPWELYDVSIPSWANDLQVLRPGHGYWILATAETDLRIVNDGSDFGVEIAQPAQLVEITEPVAVTGTVRGQSLAEWELRYRSLDGGDWITLGTGTGPVTGAQLGTFDPTLLLNGLYEIELSALAADGNGVSYSTHVVVEGQQKIGNFTLSFVDLEVPLAGIPIQIVRTYDSREKRSLDFGYGWTLDVRQGSYRNNRTPGEGWRIVDGLLPCQNVQETLPHLTTVRLSDREIYRFKLALTRPAITAGGCFAEAGFAFVDGPVPGATLQIPGNTSVFHGNGTTGVVDADSQEPYEPKSVQLRTRDGRIFDLDLARGVTRLADANGNELQITAAGITHSSGRSIAFTRDSRGRITDITDPLDRTLRYSYNAVGNLITFTNQGDETTRFNYDSSHRLLAIEDPRGIQPVRNDYDEDGRLIRSTDAFGKVIELTHDLVARREVVTDRLGHSRAIEYDTRGNLIYETDALGKVTTRTFDGHNRLLSETEPLGHTTRYVYDGDRNLIEVADPLGHRTRLSYNERGQVLTTIDARGKETRNTYDSSGNLLEVRDPLGNLTTYTHDSHGNLLTETDAEGGVTAYAYDAYGNRIRRTDAAGVVTSSVFDSSGRLLTRTTGTRTWSYEYDAVGKLSKTIDPDGTTSHDIHDPLGYVIESVDKLGRSTLSTYDDLGRLSRIRFPDGTSEQSAYDAEGRLLTSIDRGGRTTSYTYDATGRLLTAVYADGTTASNSYDAAGRLVGTTDARNNRTELEYDAAGRRAKVRDALGNETSIFYDENGNQIAVTDARGNTTAYEYDDANRLVAIRFPDGTSILNGYDRLGRRITQTDQAGSTVRFAYDPPGRLIAVTDPLNQVTAYTYDEYGNCTSQTDANGHSTRYDYDELGRRVRRTLPDQASEETTYDEQGRLRSRKDFAGRVTTFDYDIADRLIRRSSPDASVASFTYTSTGQRQTVVDGRGTTSYSYDTRGRLLELADPNDRKLTYAYDANGNRTSLTIHGAGQTLTTRFTYDALNRLDEVIDPKGRPYHYEYDANGNRTALLYPNGVRTDYTYDALNRLTGLTSTRASQLLQSYGFILDPVGNRTRVDESGETQSYFTYDALHRLVKESIARSSSLVYEKTFDYDPVGNRTRQAQTGAQGEWTRDYVYDIRDRLVSGAGTTWTWDANGNLVDKTGQAEYGWTPDDRLRTVTLPDGTVVTHSYDVDGNRVSTEVKPPDGSPQVTDYLVDPYGPLPNTVAELDGAGVLKAFHVRGDDLLAIVSPDGDRFLHADGLGSVRILTTESGEVTDRYSFTAFGELLSHEGADANAYLFAGEPFDHASSFYNLRARWMDPSVGRFVSMDHFHGFRSEPLSLHKYLYGNADPVNRIDPTGHFSVIDAAWTTFIVSALASAVAGVTFHALTLRNFPENVFSEKPSAVVVGLQWTIHPGAIARKYRHPVSIALAVGLAATSAMTSLEMLIPRDSQRAWFYIAFGISVGIPRIGRESYNLKPDIYGGLAWNVDVPWRYQGGSFCSGLNPVALWNRAGVPVNACTALRGGATPPAASVTLNRFNKYGALTSSGSYYTYLGEVPFDFVSDTTPPFPEDLDDLGGWLDSLLEDAP